MSRFSHSGLDDLVPFESREQWKRQGIYADKSLYQLFLEKVVKHPDKVAVQSFGESITYGYLFDKVLRVASELTKIGVRKGDIIAYSLPNSWYCCLIDIASAAIGAVVLPFPQGRGALDIEILLKRSCARILITETNFKGVDICEIVESFRSRALALRCLVGVNSNETPFERSGWLSFSEWILSPPINANSLPYVCPDSAAKILVSSGTEAEPKMVAYSHNALAGGRGRFLENLTRKKDSFKAFYLVPLGSAFGSTATFGVLCWIGGTLILQEKFLPETTINIIHELGPTHILGVPTMFQRLISCENIGKVNTSTLECLVTGGAPIDEATTVRCGDHFGCKVISLYGSADGINCHNSIEDHQNSIFSSVGKPNPSICDFMVVDDVGNEVSQGDIGEIMARGPITPMQYVNAPELDNLYRNSEGWVYSGDLGSINEKGYLVLAGRKKDIIIRGGVNISPVQIEGLVTSHDNILSAACVPIADPDLGQRVCLCVSLINGKNKPSLLDINNFLASKGLDVSKHPEYLCFYREIPLTPAGKINKRKLTDDLMMLSFNTFVANSSDGRSVKGYA